MYNRVENLDELIRSVKLPYLAWKVLFLVNKKANSKEISVLLEVKEDQISEYLDQLVQNGLILEDHSSEIEIREAEPEIEMDHVAEEEPEIEEEDFSEAEGVVDDMATEISEEIPEIEEEDSADGGTGEEIESDEFEQELEEETAEIEEETGSDLDIPAEESEGFSEDSIKTDNEVSIDEPEEATAEEVDSDDEEDFEDDFGSSEEYSEHEPEEAIENPPAEEKIEINIPESDDTEDLSDDMEFNFNLTGDQAVDQMAEEQAVKEEITRPKTDTSSYKKILVIDDSLVIRKMVEIALEDEELHIETAVSGKEGLEIMDQINPDLVILDMMLPDINGIEILKTIKASKQIPVIMLSGKDSPQMIETAKNEGAEEFLPKPFKDDDLVEKIKKLIQ